MHGSLLRRTEGAAPSAAATAATAAVGCRWLARAPPHGGRTIADASLGTHITRTHLSSTGAICSAAPHAVHDEGLHSSRALCRHLHIPHGTLDWEVARHDLCVDTVRHKNGRTGVPSHAGLHAACSMRAPQSVPYTDRYHLALELQHMHLLGTLQQQLLQPWVTYETHSCHVKCSVRTLRFRRHSGSPPTARCQTQICPQAAPPCTASIHELHDTLHLARNTAGCACCLWQVHSSKHAEHATLEPSRTTGAEP